MPQCGYLSETSRMIEIYRALRSRGVIARMAGHGGRFEYLLAHAGIPYDIVGPHMSAERSLQLVADSPGLGDVRQSVYLRQEIVDYAAAEAHYFRHHRISVVVTGFTLTTLLSSRLVGIPVVTEHNGTWLPPVWENGLIPAPSRAFFPWIRMLPEALLRKLINLAPPRVTWYCSAFNSAAAELGVEGLPSMAALTLGDVALLTELPEFVGLPRSDFLDWRPAGRKGYRASTRLDIAGPIFARLPVSLSPELDEFLSADGPVVYLALTSSPVELVESAVASCLATGARVLVAGTIHDLGHLANDRLAIGVVLPSHEIMPRVAVAVTTGGQGSVQTAMSSGTPLVGIALQPEQDLNVALVERYGAGLRVAPRQVGTSYLTRAVGEVLAFGGYRSKAQELSRRYAEVDGPDEAARIVIEVGGTAVETSVRRTT